MRPSHVSANVSLAVTTKTMIASADFVRSDEDEEHRLEVFVNLDVQTIIPHSVGMIRLYFPFHNRTLPYNLFLGHLLKLITDEFLLHISTCNVNISVYKFHIPV